jgi:SOS-response transcriptional repressor LexA
MSHPTANTIESYALGRLKGRNERKLEEHLFVCAPCRTRLLAQDEFVKLVRLGFEAELPVESDHSAPGPKVLPFRTHLPVYSLQAAAGKFGEQQSEVEPEGWVEVQAGQIPLTESMFVIHVKGGSMEPQIPDGCLCAFSGNVSKPYDGKVLLMEQYDEVGGTRFTVEQYRTSANIDPHTKGDKAWLHERITLTPLNPDFASWDVSSDKKIRVIGEFVFVVRPRAHRAFDQLGKKLLMQYRNQNYGHPVMRSLLF